MFQLLKLRDDHFAILGSSNTVQQGLDIVKENIVWMELHEIEIGQWLAGFLTDAPTSPITTPMSTPTTTSSSTTTPTISSTVQQTTVPTVSTTPSGAGYQVYQTNTVLMLAVFFLVNFILH